MRTLKQLAVFVIILNITITAMPFLDRSAARAGGLDYPQIIKNPFLKMPDRNLLATAAEYALPASGEIYILVVPVFFSDYNFITTNTNTLTNFLNEIFFSNYFGTVTHYYNANSFGLLNIKGIVLPPLKLPEIRSYYGDQSRYTTFAIASANLAAAAVSTGILSKYDANQDNYIDITVFIHAGQGAETSASSLDIHSHTSTLSPVTNIIAGASVYKFGKYIIVPEVMNINAHDITNLITIGTFTHELGHCFGLPDLYNTSSLNADIDNSVGSAALMDTGAYNFIRYHTNTNTIFPTYGSCPAPVIGLHKKFLGWLKFTEAPSGLNKVTDISSGTSSEPLVCIIKGAKDKEYWLIENRQGSSYDIGLMSYPYYILSSEARENQIRAQGLLIWHIDESVYEIYYNSTYGFNSVNNDYLHRAVDIEEATTNQSLDTAGYLTEKSFWASNHLDGFSDNSRPNARYYDSSPSGIRISGISAPGREMKFTATVIDYAGFSARAFPDPFFPDQNRVTIAVTLEGAADKNPGNEYKYYITSLSGRIVKTIDTEQINTIKSGEKLVFITQWDGRDNSGRICNAGTYRYYLETEISKGLAGTVSIKRWQ